MSDTTGFIDFLYHGETFQTWFRIVGDLKSGAHPLILLHGGPAIPNPYLDPHVELHASRGIPLIFYDQIGCGNSTHVRDKPVSFFNLNLFMDELDNVLVKLGVANDFDLYGHSWGGMLASDYVASRRPEGLNRLIIANAPASILLFVHCVEKLLDQMSPGLAERLKRHETEGRTDDKEYQEATELFMKKHICSIDPLFEEVSTAFKALSQDMTVYHALWGPHEIKFTGSLATWYVIDTLHAITVPTLVVNGVNDEMQDECVIPFVQGIGKVKWVRLEHSGHMPLYEEKERYFEVIGDFLKPCQRNLNGILRLFKVIWNDGTPRSDFTFADDASLARCSRVRSLWTDSALSFLWEEMEDITPLFGILAPMSLQDVTGRGYYAADRRQVYDDAVGYNRNWCRFLLYGSRIKHFTLRWSSICTLSDSAVNEIARKRPSLSITPKLQTLLICPEGTNDMDISNFSLLLMHGSVGHLSVCIPQNKAILSVFTVHLLLRIPNLQNLELRVDTSISVDNFQDTLVKLLPELRNLRSLRLPYYALTPEIIHALSANANLETIAFNDGPAHIVAPAVWLPILEVTSYPVLAELQISGFFSQLAPFLSVGCFARNLTSVTLQVLSFESAASLRVLLEILMQSLPNLSRLTVDGVPQALSFNGFPREAMIVSRTTLNPITSMKRLIEFSISWPVPIFISNSGLESLASELPRIERLSLNSCPAIIDEEPELTLDVLPALSKLCPHLRSLALYVDCIAIPSYNTSVFATGDRQHNFTPFVRLREIDFGLSPLGRDDQMFSICLSKVLPPGCVFTYHNRWLSGVDAIVEGRYGGFRETRWPGKYKNIEALTTPLIAARKDERHHAFARIRELEDRIRGLEALKLA